MSDSLYTVVYRAVADFRDLYEEIAKARAALAALQAEQAGALRQGGPSTLAKDLSEITKAAEAHATAVTAETAAVDKNTAATTKQAKAASDGAKAVSGKATAAKDSAAAAAAHAQAVTAETAAVERHTDATTKSTQAANSQVKALSAQLKVEQEQAKTIAASANAARDKAEASSKNVKSVEDQTRATKALTGATLDQAKAEALLNHLRQERQDFTPFATGRFAHDKYIAEHGAYGNATAKQRDSVMSYEGSAYYAYNKYKREDGAFEEGTYPENKKSITKHVSAINKVFEDVANQLKEDLQLFRGFSVSDDEGYHPTRVPGGLIHDKAFQSTSSDEEVAVSFAGGRGEYPETQKYLYNIQADKGTRGIAVQPGLHEREFLLDQGRYQVQDYKHEDGFHKYTVKQLSEQEFQQALKAAGQLITDVTGKTLGEAEQEFENFKKSRPAGATPITGDLYDRKGQQVPYSYHKAQPSDFELGSFGEDTGDGFDDDFDDSYVPPSLPKGFHPSQKYAAAAQPEPELERVKKESVLEAFGFEPAQAARLDEEKQQRVLEAYDPLKHGNIRPGSAFNDPLSDKRLEEFKVALDGLRRDTPPPPPETPSPAGEPYDRTGKELVHVPRGNDYRFANEGKGFADAAEGREVELLREKSLVRILRLEREVTEEHSKRFLSESRIDDLYVRRVTRERKEEERRGGRGYGNTARALGDVFRPNRDGRSTPKAGEDDLGSRVKDLQDVLPDAFDGMNRFQRIILLVLAAIVALVPVVAVLTAALGTIVAAAAGAAAALGIFAIAAIGHFKAVKENLDANAKVGEPVKKQYQDIARALDYLKAVYKAFLAATQQPVLAVFSAALVLAANLLQKVTPVVASAGRAIQNSLGLINDAGESDTFTRFVQFLSGEGSAAIVAFTRILLSLGRGLTELVLAFAPFIDVWVGGLAKMSESFANWAAGLSNSKKFQEFMDYAAQTAPQVGAAIAAIVDLFIHLGVALAPIGTALLYAIRALSAFVTAIPTSAITGFIAALTLAFIAIKALQGITTVILALETLGKFISALSVSMGIASEAAVGMRAALIGLTATTVIGIVITGLVLLFQKLSDSQKKAAEAARDHKNAVQDLGAQLQATNGQITSDVLNTQANKLRETKTAKDVRNAQDSRFTNRADVDYTIADVAQRNGVDLGKLTRGVSGDDDAYQAARKQLDQARDRALNKAYDPSLSKKDSIAANRELGAIEDAIKEYDKLHVSESEVAQQMQQLTGLTQEQTDKLQTLGVVSGTTADRLKTVAEQTDQQKLYTDAFTALDNYTQAVKDYTRAKQDQQQAELDYARTLIDAHQRVVDASAALVDAQTREQKAQESLTQARIDAEQKLIDYRRTLRDLPLDEEQASINLAKAEETERKGLNTPGLTDLDRRQNALNTKRARNSLNDTLVDDVAKRNAANKGLDLGVDGQPEVVQAVREVRDSIKAVAKATEELKRAREDEPLLIAKSAQALQDARDKAAQLEKKIADTSSALDIAAAAAGQTRDTLKDVRKKMDDITAGKASVSLELIDPNDVNGKLNEIATRMEALKLLAADPSLTAEQAYQQAAAAALKKYGTPKAPIELGGKGRSRGNQYAEGGAVFGPGTGKSDSFTAYVSNGEHVWTAAEVVAAGGHTMVQMLRMAALNKKLNARDPAQAWAAADIYRRAGFPGRNVMSDGLYRPDMSALTAGLSVAALSTATPTVAATTTLAPAVVNSRQFSAGGITINNPVREPAGDSLYRTVRRLHRD